MGYLSGGLAPSELMYDMSDHLLQLPTFACVQLYLPLIAVQSSSKALGYIIVTQVHIQGCGLGCRAEARNRRPSAQATLLRI